MTIYNRMTRCITHVSIRERERQREGEGEGERERGRGKVVTKQ